VISAGIAVVLLWKVEKLVVVGERVGMIRLGVDLKPVIGKEGKMRR
jgi:hypothetical protein